VTRWREDTTRDNWGTYLFLRDVMTGEVWSPGYQPTGMEPDRYEVDFSEDRAEIVRQDGSMITTLEVVVSPEDDAEIRRVTLKNTGILERDIEVTSYAEIVLATPAADLAHPAFSNLFVQTEFVPEVTGLIGTRRPRSPGDPSLWVGHVVVVDGTPVGDLEYESSRANFLGRGRTTSSPQCVMDGKPLSNTAGAVLDPVVSLRRRVHVKPGETVRVIFATMMASSREEVLMLADKYHDLAMFERTVTLAWTQAHIQQHHLGIQPSEAHLFQDMASRILYSDAGLRPSPEVLARNRRGAPGLWAYGISGDLPIVLVRIDEEDDRDIVRQVLRAHEYWRLKNLAVDLVILNERAASYSSELQSLIESLVRANQETLRKDAHLTDGDIFVLRVERLGVEDRVLLMTAARIIILSRHGSLTQQMERLEGSLPAAESLPLLRQPTSPAWSDPPKENSSLQFFNGLGGFSHDGREYVTTLAPGQWTPAPWINVISNPAFGFQVSESGSGYTWAGNSRENQLTPWSNDPVSDPAGEAVYIRDEESGDLWTPSALPIREAGRSYTSRHGQGYSQFEFDSHGIRSELMQFVAQEDPVKLSRLRLVNDSRRTRRLSITAYVEWVLGLSRQASGPFIVTEKDSGTGAILARNPWNTEFGEQVAFADLAGSQTAWTADRTEFLGRNGSLEHPAALEGTRVFSGQVGPGLDPCAALQTVIELRPGEQKDLLFILGQAAGRHSALELVKRYRQADVEALLVTMHRKWDDNLGAVQVRTPDRAMDVMLNRWLLYQTLACRLWARAGFYQAGGAYGFRDQLQDVMALMVSRRDLAREHILRAAARQFEEGDVQHWWHPPTGRGVRTRISDDLLWLPYVVNQYIETTGDSGILEEPVLFLEGQAVPAGKDDAYFHPGTSVKTATLFEHCARALDHRLGVGVHGLPLMGTGDWNDGMNRVGHEGKGESIWLTWFLHTTLFEFSKRAEARGEGARAETWRLHVGELKAAVERQGWDGDWYRRAYFDDGTPLGSATNKECQIDSIAQSWAVLSGAADPARGVRAMAALEKRLILKPEGLALLFAPPFDHTVPNPGYIQGYLPGVRENGGQYTHAAVWAVLAFAALGDGDKAGELFAMLNPIHHGSTRSDIQRYKVEPYVMAGDVYAEAPHTGRGGWTWYTGAAGWMYRAGIEWILGFRLRGTTLFMDPCIPRAWPEFNLSFRYHSSRYEVKVLNPKGVCKGVQSVEVDGKPVRGSAAIHLTDDGATHDIRIILGELPKTA
jgi:cyclic beta-1,2-glucan synthetase